MSFYCYMFVVSVLIVVIIIVVVLLVARGWANFLVFLFVGSWKQKFAQHFGT